jgi:hypothetical protein
VEEPFTEKARFNWEKFKKHVGLAQRIMDDIIDLELEKVDAILDKIYKDPGRRGDQKGRDQPLEKHQKKGPRREKDRCGNYR